jgi:hypothetical protein
MNIDDILPYKKWLLKAEEDFTLIKHEMFFEEKPTQKLEYLLELCQNIDFKPTHNLEYLLELCKTVDEDFSQIDIANLTDYAISARYPVNFIKPSIIETNSSVDIAMKIREFILNKIK